MLYQLLYHTSLHNSDREFLYKVMIRVERQGRDVTFRETGFENATLILQWQVVSKLWSFCHALLRKTRALRLSNPVFRKRLRSPPAHEARPKIEKVIHHQIAGARQLARQSTPRTFLQHARASETGAFKPKN